MSDDILRQLYNACDPQEPASAKFYVDFTEVRGSGIFVRKLCEELDLSEGYLRILFTGHQGCGKSSELEHLAQELRSLQPTCAHKRYFPIVVNALEYVDINDASLTEILLAVVAEIAARLREEGIELKDSYLQKRLMEIKNLLGTDVELTKIDIPLASAKAEIKLRQADPAIRQKVRDQLQPQMTSLIDEINTVFIRARTELRTHTPKDGGPAYQDIVLILDNLEKIRRVADRSTGEDSERAIFIDGAVQLTGLEAHVLYTVPLRLVRAAGPELAMAYGRTTFVLPNVKTERRGDHAPWQPGREKFRELLAKRLHPYTLAQVFTEEALEFLFDYSAGHVRQLMVFVRESSLFTQETPISLQAVQQAIRQAVPQFSTVIRNNQWPMLAELELSDDQTWDSNDEERRQLLELLCVLEYMNGGDEESPVEAAEPWYAVHPIVRELRRFRAACDALRVGDDHE